MVSTDSPSTVWNRNFVLLCVNNVFLNVAFDSLTAALPLYLMASMHLSKSAIGGALAAFSFGGILMRPFAGAGVDVMGRRLIFFGAMIAFALVFNGYLLVTTLAALAVVRFVHGMAWGATGISGAAAVVDVIPEERRSQGLAYHGMATSFGHVFAAALGLAVATAAGYGALFTGACGACLVAVALALFVKYPVEGRQPRPFQWANLLEATALPVALTFFVVSLTTGGLTGFLAIYARERGYAAIGSFFTVAALSGIAARWVVGSVFALRGPRAVSVAGIGVVGLSFPVLVLAEPAWGFPLAAALYGAGSGTLYLVFQTMVNNLVPPRRLGAANATLFTILNVGYAIGKVATGITADAIGLDRTFLGFTFVNVAALSLFIVYVLGHYERSLEASRAAAPQPA